MRLTFLFFLVVGMVLGVKAEKPAICSLAPTWTDQNGTTYPKEGVVTVLALYAAS